MIILQIKFIDISKEEGKEFISTYIKDFKLNFKDNYISEGYIS